MQIRAFFLFSNTFKFPFRIELKIVEAHVSFTMIARQRIFSTETSVVCFDFFQMFRTFRFSLQNHLLVVFQNVLEQGRQVKWHLSNKDRKSLLCGLESKLFSHVSILPNQHGITLCEVNFSHDIWKHNFLHNAWTSKFASLAACVTISVGFCLC